MSTSATHARDPTSAFDHQSRGVVDSVQKRSRPAVAEVLVCRLLGSPPVPVIIDNEDSVLDQPRIEVHKLVFRRFVPICVETKEAYIFGRRLRDRVLNLPPDEMYVLHWVAGRRQIPGHVVETRVRAHP